MTSASKHFFSGFSVRLPAMLGLTAALTLGAGAAGALPAAAAAGAPCSCAPNGRDRHDLRLRQLRRQPDHVDERRYLPAMVTTFHRDGATISITNFGDQVSIGGHDYVVIYSRVAVSNPAGAAITIDPQPSAGLIPLNSAPDTVPAHGTVNHDYAVPADGTHGLLDRARSVIGSQTQYDDGAWTYPWVWAIYLLKTGDLSFVRPTSPPTGRSTITRR